MAQKAHEWPKPMYRNGVVRYAASQSDWNLHELQDGSQNRTGADPVDGYGWTGQYVHQHFPKALHGPDDQSLSVKNQDELDRALANGWSLKPLHEVVEVTAEDVPTADRAPLPAKTPKAKPAKAEKK